MSANDMFETLVALDRLLADKIRIQGDCLTWVAYRNLSGYGRVGRRRRVWNAHRWTFQLVGGTLAEGMVLDHLCRNRACVNPEHLEQVTDQINILRGVSPAARNATKTHCTNGHEFTPENTASDRYHQRCCIACRRQIAKEARSQGLPDPADARHGTRYGYVIGCRCERCTSASAEYGRQLRARRSAVAS